MGFFSNNASSPSTSSHSNVVQALRSKFRLKKNLPTQNDTSPKAPENHVRSDETSPQTAPTVPNRHSSDFVTMTLAQRLNELSTANNEGLLDDDEYRLLRQSLFERLAGGSTVPSEPSIIPHMSSALNLTSRRAHAHSHSKSSASSRTPSHSQIASSTSSTRSNESSFSSHFHSLLRRSSKGSNRNTRVSIMPPGTPSRNSHFEIGDSSSVLSKPLPHPPQQLPDRRSSSIFQRDPPSDLGHRVSLTSISTSNYDHSSRPQLQSLHTSTSNQASDAKSIASFRTSHTNRSTHAPSSFHLRHYALTDNQANTSTTSHNLILNADSSIYDDQRLTSSERIRTEISNVEREMRGLMDAFNGLELSIETQPSNHHNSHYITTPGTSPWSSMVSLVPEEKLGMSVGMTGSSSSVNTISRNSTLNSHSLTRSQTKQGRPIQVSRKMPDRPSIPPFPVGAKTGSNTRPQIANGVHHYRSRLSYDPAAPISASISSRNTKGRPTATPGLSTTPSSVASTSTPSTTSSTFNLPPHSSETLPSNSITSSLQRNGTMQPSHASWSASKSKPLPDQSALGNSPRSNAAAKAGLGLSIDEVQTRQTPRELADVRRRRVEVAQRYEARLEFLRAKLKGAEIREKLSK